MVKRKAGESRLYRESMNDKILARDQPPERTCPEFVEMGRRAAGR